MYDGEVKYRAKIAITSSPSSSPSDRESSIIGPEKNAFIVLAEKAFDLSFSVDSSLSGALLGLKPMDIDVEYTRETSSSSTVGVGASTSSFSSKASLNSPGKEAGSVVYILRVRVRQTTDPNDVTSWDLNIPCDISKHVRLQGGQSFVSLTGSGVYTSEGHLIVKLLKFQWEGRSPLSSHPVASTYTTARYPETVIQLEYHLTQFRLWMNLILQFQFPEVFRVIVDAEAIGSYQRLFSLLIKVLNLSFIFVS